MHDLENQWLAERLTYLGRSLSRDTVWGQKVRDVFPRLESSPKAEDRRKPKGTAPFIRECRKAYVNFLGPVTFLGIERNYIGS